MILAHPPGFEILPGWMQTAWPWMLWLGAVVVLTSFVGDWWRRRQRHKQ